MVYPVIVERFVHGADLDAKRALYPPPRLLRRWDEVPQCNSELAPGTQITRHELDFWGGDPARSLGADVLYLNPTHLRFTHPKYDAQDFQAVSPEYGARANLKALAAELHRRGMKLVLDGVFNHQRALILNLVRGELPVATASVMLERLVAELGLEPMLIGRVVLADNHDVKRLATELPDAARHRLAQVLQFTLPGSPNLYRGVEVGMVGGDEPAQRGPLRWGLVAQGHPDLAWTKPLIALRKALRGLRCGVLARRDDAAGSCPRGGATPPARRSATQSGA